MSVARHMVSDFFLRAVDHGEQLAGHVADQGLRFHVADSMTALEGAHQVS